MLDAHSAFFAQYLFFSASSEQPSYFVLPVGIVSFDLIQCRQSYPKIQTQAFSISDIIQHSNYHLQIILISESQLQDQHKVIMDEQPQSGQT